MMKKLVLSGVLLGTLLLARGEAPALRAAGVNYGFSSPTGWVISNTTGGGNSGWAMDKTPDLPADGMPISGVTLNYNNGQGNYNEGFAHQGAAQSPQIDLGTLSQPTLSFYCNYETETGDSLTDGDVRRVIVEGEFVNGTGNSDITATLGTANGSPLFGACAPMNVWHLHVLTLDPAWKKITVRFLFASNGVDDDHQGWSIDQLTVKSGAVVAPAALNSAGVTAPTLWDFNQNLDGWTAHHSHAAPQWSIDADPVTVGDSFVSGPAGLNYNNGTDYSSTPDANSGAVISPVLDITGLQSPVVTFWCRYDTDVTGTPDTNNQDRRIVTVTDSTRTLLQIQYLHALGSQPTWGPQGTETCDQANVWHQHSVALDPTWGPELRIRFSFSTMTETGNLGAGWFLDDVSFSESFAPPPPKGTTTVGGSSEDHGGGSTKAGCGGSVAQSSHRLSLPWLLIILTLMAIAFRVRRNARG